MFEKSTAGDILYIRHGETNYNKHFLLNKQIQISEDFLDSSLSPEGIAQAKELSKILHKIEIGVVFCSPLNRCIETTLFSLENHPQSDTIKVIIHPYITEVVHGAQDLPMRVDEKKKKYSEFCKIKFDWSYFDYYFPSPYGHYYYLYFVDNLDDTEELKNILKEITSGFGTDCKKGVFSKFLDYFISKEKRPESLSHLLNRAVLFKSFLRDFINNDDLGGFREKCKKCDEFNEFEEFEEFEEFNEKCKKCEFEEIINNKPQNISEIKKKTLIITHSAFIRMSTTESGFKIDPVDTYPEDCYRPDNCEVISVKL